MRERRRIGIDDVDPFSVTGMKEIASMLSSVNAVPTGLLSSVAAVSLLVGVVFGYFPARRAARIVPIEALRHP